MSLHGILWKEKTTPNFIAEIFHAWQSFLFDREKQNSCCGLFRTKELVSHTRTHAHTHCCHWWSGILIFIFMEFASCSNSWQSADKLDTTRWRLPVILHPPQSPNYAYFRSWLLSTWNKAHFQVGLVWENLTNSKYLTRFSRTRDRTCWTRGSSIRKKSFTFTRMI